MNLKNSKQTLAIPFISYHQGKGFQLSPQAQEFLNNLPQDRQLGIVSIVGKYRTGKSFFVNRVLLDQKKGGFQVGPTINPCTKGLWLWKKTIQSPTNQDMDIILIDTQGFGGMDQNANHDSRIFLFSLLLSSFFIYNSVGSIDQNALNTLNLIINLAKDIQIKTNNSNDPQDNSYFPAFLWIVRDFTLQIVDKIGNKITSKQYLQNALQLQKGNSDAVENKNKIRRLLKHFFHDRDCMTMVRPVQKEKDLQRLDQMDNLQLRPQFTSQVLNIRNTIFSRVKPKKVNKRSLNGHLLVDLCKGYMDAINNGVLPNVQSAWFYVCRNEGIRAIHDAVNYLESEIQQLLKHPIQQTKLKQIQQKLKKQVLQKFQKKSMGAQQGHPDLLQKINKKLQQSLQQLIKKNQQNWLQKYRQKAQKLIQLIRDKIYRDNYNNYQQFNKDMQKMKQQFNLQTNQIKCLEKWNYLNQISQGLYRLAGQTITAKINNNLNNQKIILQQKIQIKQKQLQQRKKTIAQQKDYMKNKIQQLERQNTRLNAIQQTNALRIKQYKQQYDKLYQKFKNISGQFQQKVIQIQKLKKDIKKQNNNQIQQAKTQVSIIKSNLEKQRTLHQMEKQYLQQQLDRYKDRCQSLQLEMRKLRSYNAKLSSDLEDSQNKYHQKIIQCQSIQQTNQNYSKKIESLLLQNSKKNQIMGQHNQWILQKSYLQNQVSFLKNTLNQNKRLHDALLVALQQSIASSQGQCNNQLIEANKNLSASLQKIQSRYKILQQKYQRIKSFKKVMKNCLAMQCINCNKWIQTISFNNHLQQCGQNSIRQKTLPDLDKSDYKQTNNNIHITVSQTIIKDFQQSNKKPYTQYIIQITIGDKKWKINKRYKQFNQLQQLLINKFPYIKYPPSCNFLADINTLMSSKRNMLAQERRKSLQQYLRDLVKIQEIRNSSIFIQFLQIGNREMLKQGKHLNKI